MAHITVRTACRESMAIVVLFANNLREEAVGLVMCLLGFGLMAWALLRLVDTYRVGCIPPRFEDALVRAGPYICVRHPWLTSVNYGSYPVT
jgi:protein-S-isoprenylcysteine O-methyltransferase Ste14